MGLGNPQFLNKLFSFYLSCLLLASFAGCQGRTPWRLDPEYSEYLTIKAVDYKEMTGHSSASSVDALRIYRISGSGNDMFSLDELFKRDFLFETRDKEFITNFLIATQDQTTPTGVCQNIPSGDTLHVVLFDNTFMRAGYFLFKKCKAAETEYGVVLSLQKGGGSNIYYTRSLVQRLTSILH
jgi:hypothetical protein